MKVTVSPLDSALPMGQPLKKLYFKVLGVVYLMRVAVSPLDPALPTGQPLQNLLHSLEGCSLHESDSITLDSALPMGQLLQKIYVKALGAVYLMRVAVSPLDSALPTGQPLQN